MSNYVCISFIQAFALPFPWIYNSHSRRLCIYHPPLMGENHINIDVSILVVIFREIFKVAKFE
ncbi:uncharacterized protein BN594_03130 [Bacteroides uniformis CAG:3]|nr:uncharacterized protein BN594_03130 [Bacteroides uniformis CAG:3]